MLNIRRTLPALIIGLTFVQGCSALHTAVDKRELDVQTKMSKSIFLDPVRPELRTVFVQIRNTSDKPGIRVRQQVIESVQSQGYRITDNPEEAYYWLQANILKIGKTDLRDSEDSVSRGFGGAIAGGAIGSQVGDGKGQVAAAVVGAAIGVMTDAMVDDTLYTMITDIQISEKAKNGVIVTQDSQADLNVGTTNTVKQYSTEKTDRKKYQTRIVSTANQANLEYQDAEPLLIKGLIQSIGGIL
ncbi:complement resistance protein TraT [Algicola sagamiensis]|uniref:complement resistance protein TraT n=1 Tax=Algicola sagamiensis TaxID=163869 RepID=UPI000375DA36|nr:complement resistance protein TraT [Algicola sagamiensis]